VTAQALIDDLTRRGIRLIPEPPNLTVESKSKLTDADRALIRAHKAELLAALAEPDCEPKPAVPPSLFGHLDLAAIADAIADQPRAPFENDLALSHAARAALGAERVICDLPATARREALRLCRKVCRDAAAAICARNYRVSYDLLDNLPERLKALRPQ
jgi:hypothetical protein